MQPHVAEFSGALKEALAEVAAAGHVEAAKTTRERCFVAYTTSSEWLGEVGDAVSDLLRHQGPALPDDTREKLRYCLREVARVWPRYRDL